MEVTTDDVLGNHTCSALHTMQENRDASTGPFKHNERGGTNSATSANKHLHTEVPD